MTGDTSEHRPFRVSYTRANGRDGGTVAAEDAAEAHRTAHAIAKAGGRAEVQYVTPSGTHQTLATYP